MRGRLDLDYRALGNAGLWCVGRLQTDADRARVVEGRANAGEAGEGLEPGDLSDTIKKLSHRTPSAALLQTRWAMSWLRGPMTRAELRRGTGWRRS